MPGVPRINGMAVSWKKRANSASLPGRVTTWKMRMIMGEPPKVRSLTHPPRAVACPVARVSRGVKPVISMG
ncbi:hypothetical protein GCM10017056_46870 [Seohaeicola zhoushanensis]|uniref:Uncharacterized protein n=1 Tax=Seohaeicola zhoushanensis TaxID=1569283 RepID=A0A8J3M9U0_9RHOB|nr:hypothetical protein GCM10017056_46870 [Seohaeicola zhoushanensis]